MDYPDLWDALRVEMRFDGETWTDVSADLPKQSIPITRGRADEQASVQPAECTVVLDNRSGDYTPGRAASPHYPHVRRGVPMRIRVDGLEVPGPPARLELPGETGSYASASDASLEITGDLDLRIDIEPETWRPDEPYTLCSRYLLAGDNRAWLLRLLDDGRLEFSWSPDGTFASLITETSTIPMPDDLPRRGLRIILQVAPGGGPYELDFFISNLSANGPWAELGDFALGPSTTSVSAAPGADLEVGTANAGSTGIAPGSPLAGRVHALLLVDGVGATSGDVAAFADFTILQGGEAAFADRVGLDWSLQGGAEILASGATRFTGEVASWEPLWPYGDLSHEATGGEGEAYVQVTAAGAMRRLGQGGDARSFWRRWFGRWTGDSTASWGGPLIYWPMEEGRDAMQAAAASPGTRPMRPLGRVEFAGGDSSLPGGGNTMQITEDSRANWNIPPLGAGGEWQLAAMVHRREIWEDGVALFVYRSTGSIAWWSLQITTSGGIRLVAVDTDDNPVLVSTGFLPVDFFGHWTQVRVGMRQVGSDVGWFVGWIPETGGTGSAFGGTISGHTLGAVTAVQVGAQPLDEVEFAPPEGMSLAHLYIVRDWLTYLPFGLDTGEPAPFGFAGEVAGRRIARLCDEESVPLQIAARDHSTASFDFTTETMPMGPQETGTLLEILASCAAVDGGILSEDRSGLGLVYRIGRSLYSQEPRLELDASADGRGDIVEPFAPTLDDQATRNDVTADRTGGSSARARDEEHIAAEGLYDESVTVNTASDVQLSDQAGWRLHLGTWPGMRYPAVTPALNVQPGMVARWCGVELGDRVQVTGLPPQHPVGTVDLLAQGYAETLQPHRWDVEVNATPGGPWTVGRYAVEAPSPEFVASEWVQSSTTVAEPAGVVEGDLLIAIASNDGSALSGPSGWAQVGAALDGGSNSTHANVWMIVRGASPPDLTWTGTASFAAIGVVAYRGADASLVDVQMGTAESNLAPSATATGGGQLLVCLLADSNWELLNADAPDGMTKRTADLLSASIIADELVASGATGTREFGNSPDPVGAWSLIVASAESLDSAAPERYDTFGSRLTDAIGDVDTVFDVTTAPTGTLLWITTAGFPDHFPLDIRVGGEVMRVTGIVAGFLNVQEFTVVRAVNGVVKSHAAGSDVRLAPPAYYGL